MGWTYDHKPANVSASEYIRGLFREGAVVDIAIVKFREAYVAVRNKAGEVYCAVFLLNYAPNDYFNFGYKDMDETMHPYVYNCPKRILDLLTPTDNEHALKWREECRKRLAKAASKPKLKTGHYIIFDRPISFNNGDILDAFYIQDARRRIFTHGYGRYKISKHAFDSRNYEVLTPEEFAARKQ